MRGAVTEPVSSPLTWGPSRTELSRPLACAGTNQQLSNLRGSSGGGSGAGRWCGSGTPAAGVVLLRRSLRLRLQGKGRDQARFGSGSAGGDAPGTVDPSGQAGGTEGAAVCPAAPVGVDLVGVGQEDARTLAGLRWHVVARALREGQVLALNA
nr:hypothetical protein [Synechococcus sp. A15-44]